MLADRAGVGVMTVNQFEKGAARPRRATLEVIGLALENAGVEFLEENGTSVGVRLREPKKKI